MENGKRAKEKIQRNRKVTLNFSYKSNTKQRKDLPIYKKCAKSQQTCVYVSQPLQMFRDIWRLNYTELYFYTLVRFEILSVGKGAIINIRSMTLSLLQAGPKEERKMRKKSCIHLDQHLPSHWVQKFCVGIGANQRLWPNYPILTTQSSVLSLKWNFSPERSTEVQLNSLKTSPSFFNAFWVLVPHSSLEELVSTNYFLNLKSTPCLFVWL